ncbi:AsmA family protein [Rhizobium sp. B230/85]|uniref:AsmA family protein n=1 Tax=Rhizobium sp. B230/85 TaxID=2819994 RepID=UPI001ADC18CA|nr:MULTISPECIES: AsmA family protein [unclassified Rhizobium]MBO9132356.1 AsmA family protein [Rhizobium sp. B209b/85]QXZ95108.1 AsmA family protein [Rhizobium sp. B230/85]
MLGKVLVFLGGVLVVVLFVALLAPLFIDWTGFRQSFEEQASRIIGKKVTVHGSVDARLLPFPSVTLHDVRVGQEPDGTPIVQISEFAMDAELAPFLSGEALIFDMRISQPKVRLRLLKDGTLDWMRGSQSEIPAKSVVLENVHVDGGSVEFIDEQSGRTRHITDLNAEMSAKSLAGPWRVEGEAALDGEQGKFTIASSQPDDDGVLKVRTRLVPQSHPVSIDLDGELKLVASKPDYLGTFSAGIETRQARKVSGDAKSSEPRAKGKFELTNDRIRIPEYRLELGASDDPYVITGEATLDTGPKPEFLLTADGQQIDVNRLGNQGSEGKTTRNPAVSARQRLSNLIAIAAEIPVPQVPGKATVRLPAIVAGDTTLRDVQLDLEPAGAGWTVDKAVGTLPGRTQVEAKGKLLLQGDPNFTGNLLVASSQPSGLATWLSGTVDPSIRELKAAGFSADVNLTHLRQRFDNLEIAIGEATLKGRLDRQLPENQAPTLAVDLNGDSLDLDALRALTGLFTGQEPGENILDHKINAHLKADKFSAFGIAASDVETTFGIADGALKLDKLFVRDVAGAEITATGRASGSLLEYKGSGEITFKAADPTLFFTMLSQHLPHHPVVDRLVRNGAWYGNTALRGALTLGGDQGNGLALTLAGVSNGSRVNLDYRMSDLLALTGKGTTTLEATLENSVTSILFGQAGFDPLPVDADANGRLTLKVSATDNDPADAALTFATDKTSFTANGKVDVRPATFLNGTMALSMESADLDPYLVMNGIGMPQMGTGLPAKLQTTATIDSDKVAFSDIKGQFASNGVTGKLAFDRKAPNIKASGDIAMTEADLEWLGEAIFGPMTDPADGSLTRAKLGLPMFTGTDINIKLSAKQMWPGIFGPVSDFTTNMSYKGDALQFNDMAGKWSGGTIGGRLLLANNDGNALLQTKIDLGNPDLAVIGWQRDGAPVATGRAGLSLNMEASGKSVSDLAASASGSGQVMLGETRIRGLNLGILPSLLSATDQIQGAVTADKVEPIVQTLLNNGDAVLKPLTMPLNISGGRVRIDNVVAMTDTAQLTGNADINLSDETIRGALAISLNAGADAVSGADPALRLGFTGPLATPTRSVDSSAVTSFLSLRAFERERRRVERLQSGVLEKQRLRREVALTKFAATERDIKRQQDAVIEEQRKAEEERLRMLAEQAETQRQAEAATKAKLQAEADAAAKAEADAAAKAQAEAQAQAEEKAKADAAVKAKIEAATKARAEALAKFQANEAARAEAEAKAKADAEQKAKSQQQPPLPAPLTVPDFSTPPQKF